MQLKRWLLALLLVTGPLAANETDTRPTEILGTLQITDFEAMKKEFSGPSTGAFFTETGDTIWVMVHYIAQIGDADSRGETSFEIIPMNVQVPMGQNIMLFQSDSMAKIDPKQPLRLNVGGKLVELDDDTLRTLMSEEDFKAYQASREPPAKMRQLIALRKFIIPPGSDTEVRVEVVRNENMLPQRLEMVVGRGAVPPELLAFMEAQNGSWFYRNRHLLAMLGTVLLGGGYVLRRLKA